MGKKFVPPDKNVIVSSINPWLKGFINKEYGHTNPDDRADLEQEGYLSLLALLNKMESQAPRFDSEEEFYFYIKAVIRNAIRDYILKFRSRFGISLFKLRRVLKGKGGEFEDDDKIEKRLGDFMHSIGEEFVRLSEGSSEDQAVYAIRQRRLSLLSEASKNCKDMGLEESKSLLYRVIEEYKKTESVKAPFEAPAPPVFHSDSDLGSFGGTFVTRTPVPGRKTAKKCASRFCSADLQVKMTVVERGFGYCSKRCKKDWPPIINKIQSSYGNTPIEVILKISLKLFRSKRRAAEILEISTTTFEKLAAKFDIE